jgi:hypothetical protein
MKLSFFTLSVVVSAIMSSCNVAYKASSLNTPLFSGKGELAVNASTGNIQVAYAVQEHFGVMANGFFEREIVSNNETGEGGTGYCGELGAGYFTTVSDPNVIFEAYAGMGIGHLYLNNNYRDNNDNIQKRTLDANGFKAFIQPAIGYRLPYVEVSGALRYTLMSYSDVRTSNFPQPELTNASLNELGDTPYHFIEPGFTVRGGFKNVKLQLQYLYCFKLNSEDINYATDQLLIGVFIKLPTGSTQ